MSKPEALLPISWETRNLSRPSFELSKAFRRRPSLSGLSEALRKNEAEAGPLFVQCRASRESRALFKVLRRSRFIPVENTLVPVLRLGNECFRACGSRPMPDGFKVVRASKKNREFFRAARRIAARAFRTDRFHRDRHCPQRVADQRFVHWVRELRSDPAAEFYAIYSGRKTASFFVFRKGYLVLNATSREFAGKGLGVSFYRLPSEMTAAFLLAQLEEIQSITERRFILWNAYHRAFEMAEKKGTCRRPVVPAHCTANAHLYYLLLSDRKARDRMIQGLAERGIHAVFHYVPLHDSPAGRKYGRAQGQLPVTRDVSSRLIRLPLWLGLEAQQDFVIESVLDILKS